MKTLLVTFTSILLSFVLSTTATAMSSQDTATIQINGKKVVIPLKNQNHWIHITEKSDGKISRIVVQSQDGKHGKVLTKHFKINNKHSGDSTYNMVEYSSSHKLNKAQTKEMLHDLRTQQIFMHRFFMQQQHEMQAQIAAMNRQMITLQKQFAQMQIVSQPASMKKTH